MKSQSHYVREFGPFRIDMSERVLLREGRPVPLTPKAFDCLFVLVENSGHIVEKDELMRRVWPDTFVEEVNLARHISTLRKVLGASSNNGKYIETVAKRGYRFIADVKEVQNGIAALIVEEDTGSDILIEQMPNGETNEADRIRKGVIAADVVSQPGFRGLRKVTSLLVLALTIGIAGWLIVYHLPSKSSVPPVALVPLTSFPGSESQASFSADGKQIAFVWNGEKEDNFDIYVKLIDAGIPLRLTSDPDRDTNPVWSPDGRYIAFRRGVSKSTVYLIPALGGPERKLAEVNAINYGSTLDWSPDGKVLATVDRCGSQEPCSLSLISIETGEKQRLTVPPSASGEYNGDTNPAFSPDGKTIGFIRIGSLGVSDIYVTPASGGEPRRLTFDNKTAIGLAWTADGREIIFRSNRGGYQTLWRISASGGLPEPVAATGENAIEPAIARQGQRLVYTRRTMDSNVWRIEGAKLLGRSNLPTRLISSTRTDASPQLSPDGKRISFGSDRSGSMEIWICDSEGLNPIQLTSFGGAHTGTPRWSPDSHQIAFDSRPEGHADIYVISADGGKPRRLTTETSEDVVPSWSTDGRWIYFGSKRSGDWQIWKIQAEGGDAVQVTKKGGFAALESPDGKFVYYSNGPLWRIPVGGGAETPVPGFTEAVPSLQWAVSDHGIYFVRLEASSSRSHIEFFSFATGQVTQIVALEKKFLADRVFPFHEMVDRSYMYSWTATTAILCW